jgi:hypothetical protein
MLFFVEPQAEVRLHIRKGKLIARSFVSSCTWHATDWHLPSLGSLSYFSLLFQVPSHENFALQSPVLASIIIIGTPCRLSKEFWSMSSVCQSIYQFIDSLVVLCFQIIDNLSFYRYMLLLIWSSLTPYSIGCIHSSTQVYTLNVYILFPTFDVFRMNTCTS